MSYVATGEAVDEGKEKETEAEEEAELEKELNVSFNIAYSCTLIIHAPLIYRRQLLLMMTRMCLESLTLLMGCMTMMERRLNFNLNWNDVRYMYTHSCFYSTLIRNSFRL